MPKANPVPEDYHQRFTDTLVGLNPAQRRAVDQIEGPVLVIAGPGTGKTHVLSARIGRILLDTDTLAQNVLCLTFTDAGVKAMRDRLLSFIGPEAHRIPIYTFHAFCNAVIQDNLELFGQREMEAMSDLDRIDIIHRVLDELDPNHPLRRGRPDPYFYANHLIALFKRMKMEDWTQEKVLQAIDRYLEDIPGRPEFQYQRNYKSFKKGDPKPHEIEKVSKRMELLRAAVPLFSRYEQEKKRQQRYDYEDMILWVLRVFEEEKAVLRKYQEQFLYLLVDEYQDTNGSQNELIRMLADYWDSPNLFVVGDDDQSIYEFQGARLKNLQDLYQTYQPDLELIVLEDNYRSTAPILGCAEQLIQRNELRLIRKLKDVHLEKKLHVAHPDRQRIQKPVEVHAYPNRLQEIAGIVEQIRTRLDQGVRPEEMAVIYAQHRQVEPLQELLLRQQIPFQARRRTNILDTGLFRKIRELLQFFTREMRLAYSGDQHLFQILHFDFLELIPADLARISHYLDRQTASSENDPQTWRATIADEQALRKAGIKGTDRLRKVSMALEDLLKHSVNLSPVGLLEQLLNRLSITAYAARRDDPLREVQILSGIFNFVREECRKNPDLSLPELLRILERMRRNRLALGIDQSLDTDTGVQLVTAHSAKGLEFRTVFMLDTVQKHWLPNRNNHRFEFHLPDTLSFSGEEDVEEARRRLFYVGMTRAEVELLISYSNQDEQGKPLERARFIDEILEHPQLVFSSRSVEPDRLLQYQVQLLTEAPEIRLQPLPKPIVDELLGDFRLSISALNSYLKCPLGFYYQYVLKMPALMSEAGSYGQAVHQALQNLFLGMQRSRPRNFPGRKVFLESFRRELGRFRPYFTEESFARYLERGLHNLDRYYQYAYGRWNKRVVVEYTVRNAEVEGVPITGTIDKIEFGKQQQVHIVDYKTGRPDKNKVRSASDRNPEGGHFWRQLVFYKLLYENFDQSGRIVKRATIDYVEPDAAGEFVSATVEFAPGDTQPVRDLIQETYKKIQTHDFYTGCGEKDCKWCTFVRENHLPDRLSDEEIEELDD